MKLPKFDRNSMLIAAAVLGLVVVPSIAMAQNDGREAPRENEVSQDEFNPAEEISNVDTNDVDTTEDTVNEQGVKIETEDNAVLPADSITTQEAIDIAKNLHSNSTVEKVEIEIEDGATVYSVRFTDDARVDVRASDGQVIRNESGDDDDRDERDEDDDNDRDEDDDENDEDDDNSGRDHSEDD